MLSVIKKLYKIGRILGKGARSAVWPDCGLSYLI